MQEAKGQQVLDGSAHNNSSVSLCIPLHLQAASPKQYV